MGRAPVQGAAVVDAARQRGAAAGNYPVPSSESRYMLILVRAPEVLDLLVTTSRKCTLPTRVRKPAFAGHSSTRLWWRAALRGDLGGHACSWSGPRCFSHRWMTAGVEGSLKPRAGAALLLAVDLVCAVARVRKPTPSCAAGSM